MDLEAWRALHRSRFPELPFDCGNRVDPGVIHSTDLRDWSRRGTTPDQYRIEAYVDRFDLKAKRILHIGIGNSGLAKRFHRRTGEIIGTSIDEPELELARSLALPNYRVVAHNKYSGDEHTVPGRFDFIVDNNLTSACCCLTHLAQLFAFFDAKLAADGQIVTDLEGLAWVPQDANPRWSFSFDDLAAVAPLASLSRYRINRHVCVIARVPPPRARLLPLTRHHLRQARFIPGKVIGVCRRGLRLMLRPGANAR